MNPAAADAPRRIALQTWGSDGDIHPFLALAGALARRGHQVTLALTSAERKSYSSYADHHGFKLVEIGFVFSSEADTQRVSNAIEAAKNPLHELEVILDELLAPCLPEIFRVAEELCAANDLMVGHFIAHPIHAAAERANIPYLTLTLNQSAIPTRSLPPVGFPNMGQWLNGLSWSLSMFFLERSVGRRINAWRTGHGFQPLPSFREAWESRRGNLIAVSPQFCPTPADWATYQHVCGFFPPPQSSSAEDLAPEVKDFLAAGTAPVYFTFGSMLAAATDNEQIVETVQMMCDSAALCGCRAIVQAPWSRIAGIKTTADILRLERAPHLRIFPHCSAIVHHGGAGTTQTSTLCGRPSVVVAHFGDQFFWGQELSRLGIAHATLNRRKVTANILARALTLTLDNPRMTASAKALGARLAAEDGLARAVDLIERTAA
jgi:UDP:flavonoid glycosyltransferase YjiC (YdhE family)